ncbi:MAG: MarR family winged helix-turn-helix transcriptional regulator [bacterium]
MTAPASSSRALVDEVVDQITAWNPREFLTAFGRMHHGQISLVHLNVLMLLETTGPLPMHRLADALDISVASVTGVVDRMEVRGLVERRRDAEDRRVVLVHLAAGGQRLFTEIDEKRRQGLGKLLAHLTDGQLQGLLEGHRALHAARAAYTRAEVEREFASTLEAAATEARA